MARACGGSVNRFAQGRARAQPPLHLITQIMDKFQEAPGGLVEAVEWATARSFHSAPRPHRLRCFLASKIRVVSR